MAVMRGASRSEQFASWKKENPEITQRCLARVKELPSDVFSSTDKFRSYLDLMARIHYYDAYNLLLIWEQCPSASFLAGYRYWEQRLPSGSQILKDAHKGKGIDLLAPFTDGKNLCLTWYSVRVFDISQTTAKFTPELSDPAYVHDAVHEDFLMDALMEALGTKFEKSVISGTLSQTVLDADLPGEILEDAVIVRKDLSAAARIQWLTLVLTQLTLTDAPFNDAATRLLRNCICYCLLRIWGFEKYAQAPTSSIQLQSVGEARLSFLHLLRDLVREMNNLIASCYLAKRLEQEDAEDPDLDGFVVPFH